MQNLTHKLARSILTSDGIAAVGQLQAAADEAHRIGYPGAAASRSLAVRLPLVLIVALIELKSPFNRASERGPRHGYASRLLSEIVIQAGQSYLGRRLICIEVE